MTRMYVATKVRVLKAVEGRSDSGQGALEYVGVVMIAAVIIATLWAVSANFNLGTKFTEAWNKIFNSGG